MKQRNLFGELEPPTIAIEESANRLGVSTATIRNWIKTKYLEQAGKGRVTLESLEKFQAEVSGKEKLNKRANKSLKDSHDHENTVSMFLDKISSSANLPENFGIEYESSLSDSYRNKEGIYYTPQYVICDFFEAVKEDCNDLTFCDPCCGSGNFIIEALSRGFRPENIFGFDTDPVAVTLTKKRIYDSTGYLSENIIQGDFIEHYIENMNLKYDVIMTNPPWGKKINKDLKNRYAKQMGIKKSSDTSSFFFFASLGILKENGYLGFLLQEAFFNIETFVDAREKALSCQLISIRDYGKLFAKLQTKAISITLKKTIFLLK